MNAVYVADLMKDNEIVETPEDTYPPGVEPLPAFALIWEDEYVYRQMGANTMLAIRSIMNARKVDTIYLKNRGGAMSVNLVWPAVSPGAFCDLDQMVFVDDQGGGQGGRLHGRPWYSLMLHWDWDEELQQYTLQAVRDNEDNPVYRWWKRIYTGVDLEGNLLFEHYYWDCFSWIGPWAPEPDLYEYPDHVHPSSGPDNSILDDVQAAINNGFDITVIEETGEILWPLSVPETGFCRIARMGVIVKTPKNYQDLRIRFTSNLSGASSNFNITVLVTGGLPNMLVGLLEVDPEDYHTPDENSAIKEIAVDPSWLDTEEPLIVWILLRSDYEGNFTELPPSLGYFENFEIEADGEVVDFDGIPWTPGTKTKIKVVDSSPVVYRELQVVR
ncbi:MAG TPA: hypothetical protein PLX83_19635 [bacterium]|nr:hypothetical protein [bacterium]